MGRFAMGGSRHLGSRPTATGNRRPDCLWEKRWGDGGTCMQPSFESIELLREDDSVEWPHLRDLPVAMRKARGER